MKEKNIEGVLVSSELNQQYVSSFAYTDGYVIVFQEKAYLLADFRYIEAAEKEVSAEDFEIIQPKYSQLKLLSELAEKNGAKEVLVEEATLSLSDLSRLEGAADGKLKYVSGASKIIGDMRIVKDEKELDAMARAQDITDAAFTHILNFIKLNMTEKEIALELEFFMRKNGAERTSFDTIAVSGTASSMPHGVPRDQKLERGFLTHTCNTGDIVGRVTHKRFYVDKLTCINSVFFKKCVFVHHKCILVSGKKHGCFVGYELEGVAVSCENISFNFSALRHFCKCAENIVRLISFLFNHGKAHFM